MFPWRSRRRSCECHHCLCLRPRALIWRRTGRAYQAGEWEDIPALDILAEHQQVFDTPVLDEDSHPLDLCNYPLYDEDGFELPIYTREGFVVPRKRPTDDAELRGPGCGLLLDLRRIHELFLEYADDSDAMQRLLQQERERRRQRRRGVPVAPGSSSPSPAPSSPPQSSSPAARSVSVRSTVHGGSSPPPPGEEDEDDWEHEARQPQCRRRGRRSRVRSLFTDDEAQEAEEEDEEPPMSDFVDGAEQFQHLYADGSEDELEQYERMELEQLRLHDRSQRRQRSRGRRSEEEPEWVGHRGRARDDDASGEEDDAEGTDHGSVHEVGGEDEENGVFDDIDEVEALLGLRRPAQANKRLRVTGYPQAFLGYIGHVQANQTPSLYEPFMVNIDRELRKDVPEQPDFHETLDDGADFIEPDLDGKARWYDKHGFDGPIIELSGFQAYNAMSHRARPTASQQEVCTGMLTQAATGPWAPGKRAAELHARILKRNDIGLPHDRFRYAVIDQGTPNISLRLENNLTIFVRRMPEIKRAGM